MTLELIIGPSGFGKTKYILDDIEKNRDKNKIIVLTPEQNSFNFEKALCDRFGGTFNIDVMNFSSLTRKFSSMLGLDSVRNLGEDIKPFYFYKAARNLESSDNFLVKRILQDSTFIEVVDEIIVELKDYQLNAEILEDYLNNNDNLEKAHREKLEAILEIYIEYTKLVALDNSLDKQAYINEVLMFSHYLDLSDYVFYIDAFFNFTGQEYNYIEKLILKSKKVVLSVLSDTSKYFNFDVAQLVAGYELENLKYKRFYLSNLYKEPKYKLDIFRKSHEIVANVNEILRKHNEVDFSIVTLTNFENITGVKFSIKDDKVEDYRVLGEFNSRFNGISNFTLASEYYKTFKSHSKIDDSVEIIYAKNKELEVRQVAREITKLVRDNGVSTENIAILYRDDIYEKYLNIFRDYEIEVHLDKNQDVTNHRLIKFLKEVLQYNGLNYKEDILNILKTKLSSFEYLYKIKALSRVLFEDISLSEREFYNRVSELDDDTIKELIQKNNDRLINFSGDKVDISTLFRSVRVVTIADLENIFDRKLVSTIENIKIPLFIEPILSYNKEQLTICREVLIELDEKIIAVSKSSNVQIKRYIKRIGELFTYCNIRMYLDKEDGEYDNIEDLKIDSIDRQVYKKTLELLKNLLDKFGNDKLEYNKFVELLYIGLDSIKYRSIPEINNAVIMSKMDLAKVENKDYVFVIGFNKDVLPIPKKEGLISDSDKEYFSLNDIFLSPTTEISLIDEEFVAYVAITRATKKTYILYSLLDSSFKENFASPYLMTVRKLLPMLEERTTDSILEFNIGNYEYYKSNLEELLTAKELNYLFSKVYNRFIEIKDTNTKEVAEAEKLLTALLNKYTGARRNSLMNTYGVYGELNDRLYYDNENLTKNYLEKMLRSYSFELSKESVDSFLEKNNEKFSKFSISKINDFEKNPYLFFVKRVLGIDQEMDRGFDSLVVGRFFHAVMSDSRVIDFIVSNGGKLDVEMMVDEDIVKKYPIKELIEQVISDAESTDIKEVLQLLPLLNTHSYIFKNILSRLEIAIAVEIKYYCLTKYMPKHLEKKFNLVIREDTISCEQLETGKTIVKKLDRSYKIPTINFVGFIDRVDINDKNIAVIDYKSSQTDFSLESLELGFISQVLTYSLACEMLFDKKSEDILGIFYREIAKLGKELKIYRLRGLGNSDLLLQEDFSENVSDVMYIRTTKKGAIHGADAHKAYNSKELEVLVEKNLNNVLSLLEEIYKFDYSLGKYEIENEYSVEKQTLFNYATNMDTRLEYKEKVDLKPKELRSKLLD